MRRRTGRRTGLRLLALVLAVGSAVLPAGPAAAHSVGGVGATNFRTTLTGLSPPVAGVALTVIENGSRLRVRNDTQTEVVVRGYQGEPYLRVGGDGVFVNDNSPATYLNRDRNGVTPVPARAGPGRSPEWRKVSGDRVYRWHDHRIHWMLQRLPPGVASSPDTFHHIAAWTVVLDHGDQRLTASGALDWVPGPAPWGWLGVAVLLTICVAAVGLLRRPHRWLAAVTGLLVAADVGHTVGFAAVADASLPARIGMLTIQLMLWPFAVAVAVLLARRRTGGIWLAAVAGAAVVVTTGWPDLPVLWRSSVPSVLPLALDRASASVVLGVGLGLIAALPVVLRTERRRAGHAAGTVTAAAHLHPAAGGTEPIPASTTTAVREPDVGGSVAAARPDAEPVAAAGTAGPEGGSTRFSRRGVVGYVTASGLGGLAGMGLGVLDRPSGQQPRTPMAVSPGAGGSRTVPFHGRQQAGIATPVRRQAHGRIAAYDLRPGANRAALRAMLRGWTATAATLAAGRPLDETDPVAAGGGPAGLTITVGFGPSVFGKAGLPRTARPEALTPMPAFPGERLDPARSDGDLGVLICADDPSVVFHAARALERLAGGTARLRWQMSGFTGTPNTSGTADHRNLMGHLDGTNNPRPTDADFDTKVFVPDDAEPAWMRGGSYLVVRRIRILMDSWDGLDLTAQQRVIGRRKDNGAPLSGGGESTPANFGTLSSDGNPAIPADAHIRRAAPEFNNGAAMLRRGLSFADGVASDGHPDAGLLFLAWQADPRHGFMPVQRRLAEGDALSRFVRHESSALFAMPGGVAEGDYLGQGLLDS
ncbi:Dyp-type peroxidase [Micromonospora sp. WMMD1120]|uniref:Dyp-type peroxidase n=1 Tax=Micromonospora sp. WMMD1120 TaxID=3016106 RepID=UPI0024168FC2|nr:Dyp-type peroxidase [Micromonospora sp. WMMD1120]MDG4810068.1 Dyp-type peroxidase [Micromonospora sp. WMMD1120]